MIERFDQVTDKMKSDLDNLNRELTIDDIKNHFFDITDWNGITFTNFRKVYRLNNSKSITYPYLREDDEVDYDRPVEKPTQWLTYTIYVDVDILREDFRDKYLECRHELTNLWFKDLYEHELIEFNCKFCKYPNGEYSSNNDVLHFWPKKSLWLK